MVDGGSADDVGVEESTKPRGPRAWWALVLLLFGAAIGAAVGWTTTEATYRAEALLYIAPDLPPPHDPAGGGKLVRFAAFVSAQVAILESRRLARMAMDTEEWRATGEGGNPEGEVAAFEARRRIRRRARTSHIRVAFVDTDPDVALAGVRALVKAYLKVAPELNVANGELESAHHRVEVLHGEIKDLTEQIHARTADYGSREALELFHHAAIKRLLEAEEQLEEVRARLRDFKAPVVVAVPPKPRDKSPGETGEDRDADDPGLKDLLARIKALESAIEKLSRDWNRARGRGRPARQTLAELKEREARLLAHRQQLRMQARKHGDTRAAVQRLVRKRAQLERKLEQTVALKDALTSELLGAGRIRIPDPGQRPTEPGYPGRGRRLAIGACLGALLGLLVWLAAAVVGSRRRSRVAAA